METISNFAVEFDALVDEELAQINGGANCIYKNELYSKGAENDKGQVCTGDSDGSWR